MRDDFPREPKLDKKGYDDFIKRQLQTRRAQNNDSMWRKVGIKYMGDRKLWNICMDGKFNIIRKTSDPKASPKTNAPS